MNEFMSNLVDNAVQCWGCPVFDNLFMVVSNAGSAAYSKLAQISFAIFAVIFVFYVVWAVWQHVNPKKPDTSDKMYMKTVGRVVINSLFALTLLGMGIAVPRFVSKITFEPVADIALVYTHTMLNTSETQVNQKVSYVPKNMNNNGIYTNELKNKVLALMKTTITQFQSYMKFGIAVIDQAFTWTNIRTVGGLTGHFLMLCIGIYLFYGFFKLFLRYCFYFVDVIIAMAMFAFFFPIALMLFSFRGASGPGWLSGLGKGLGTNQIKTLINAIITLVSVIITYTVMTMIISRFFVDSNEEDLMNTITSGEIFSYDLSDDKAATVTLGGAIVLVFVLNYLYEQIPNVTKMILSVFNVSEQNKESESLANDASKLFSLTTAGAKTIASIVANNGKKSDDSDKKEDKKETK